MLESANGHTENRFKMNKSEDITKDEIKLLSKKRIESIEEIDLINETTAEVLYSNNNHEVAKKRKFENVEATLVKCNDDDKPASKKTKAISLEISDLKIVTTKPTTSSNYQCSSTPKPYLSPKKRINLNKPIPTSSKEKTQVFQYGNYSKYYGYRNLKDFHDVRLDVFASHKELFEGKEILDIGCNSGLITMEISKNFGVKHITGIDIDKGLINRVVKHLQKTRKNFQGEEKSGFPFNLNFVHGNYVLQDDVLLEIETAQFDLLLCLSVTKWIHLNFGDAGLKQAFKRMFLQLRPGGSLILEAQPWNGYKRRKKLTPEIFANYKAIKFLPKDFTSFLLGPEVGFSEVHDLDLPKHSIQGFRRPIQVFVKQKVEKQDL